MRDVYLSALGLTPVGEHWEASLRQLAVRAILALRHDAAEQKVNFQPDALFVGNMLAGVLSHQEHLGALIADAAGLWGIEAATLEAAGASGGAAMRQAYLAVASGFVDSALVVGVEKMTDKVGTGMTAATMTASDSDWEAAQGATPAALAAMVMQRYLHENQVNLAQFAGFSVNAHTNAKTNPHAMFRNTLTAEAYAKAGMVAEPINMFDGAPEADGAAALLITATPGPVRVAASAMASDTLALHDRPDLLTLEAARKATFKAYEQAGIGPDDVAVFELHDAFTIFAALSLEAAGFVGRGQGWQLADGQVARAGRIPIATFGGLKARGNPGGATGVYQLAEVALQLRGMAGPNQVAPAPGAASVRWGLAQCLGGVGATAVTHVLEKSGR